MSRHLLLPTLIILGLNTILLSQNKPSLIIQSPYKKDAPATPTGESTELDAVQGVINGLFLGMFNADTAAVSKLFIPTAKLTSTGFDAQNRPTISEMPVQQFIKAIAGYKRGAVNEKTSNTKIEIKDQLASVWTDYHLYVNGAFIHCGVDAFLLVKQNGQWKIASLADTRTKTNCPEDPLVTINSTLDQWHQMAAKGDENYFNTFTPDGIFLGTDASERWSVDEFKKYAKPSFDKNIGWEFKPFDRQVFFYEDNRLAWFEEKLETWMGPCRGSGVMVKTDGGWKLKQYNLAILVPNDKINDYLKLLPKK